MSTPPRLIRGLMSAFVLSLPVLAFDQHWIALLQLPSNAESSWYVAVGLVLLGTTIALGTTFFWATRLRLSRIDTLHFLLGPTAPSAF